MGGLKNGIVHPVVFDKSKCLAKNNDHADAFCISLSLLMQLIITIWQANVDIDVLNIIQMIP